MTSSLVEMLGLKDDIVRKLKPVPGADNGHCLELRSQDSQVRYSASQQRLTFVIPQAWMQYQDPNWVPPSRWSQGVSGALLDYNLMASRYMPQQGNSSTSYREMLDRKITPFRMRMLQAIWSGYQTREELIAELDAPKSKIWNEKHRLLIQLGMDARLRNLLYGTRFCLFLQRTAFMSPAETEHLRAEAREQLTTGTENYCTKIITNEATS